MTEAPAWVTIGVYGFTEPAFFEALQQAGVDAFCDIRWRRGVRGSEYAFVNSARLQRRLAELGIRYRHFRELAPAPELRRRQTQADAAAGILKRQRTVLGETFVAGYEEQNLRGFDSGAFLAQLPEETVVVALFCVERDAAACHRSLLAARLERDLGVRVKHLVPGPAAA
ncbi:MAG: DUF488 domain-containing protein [Verrucomicrobiales bacterium]|nr:DUF488 domain-containing protein [Verrucomicrobiales bacterium]